MRWTAVLPAAGDGVVRIVEDGLIVSGPDWIGRYAYDGCPVWMDTATAVSAEDPVLLDRRTVARIEGGEVVVRDGVTGETRWRWAAPHASGPAGTPWGDVVLLDATDPVHRVVQCRRPDGRVRWTVPLAPADPPPAPFGLGRLLVIDHGGALRAYDEEGAGQWESRPGGQPVRVVAPPVRIDDDRVVIELAWTDGTGLFEVGNAGPDLRRITDAGFVLMPPVAARTGRYGYVLAGALGQIDTGNQDFRYPLRMLSGTGHVLVEHPMPAEFTGVDLMPGAGAAVSGSPSEKVWRTYGLWQDVAERAYVRLVDQEGDEVFTWPAPGRITHAVVSGPDGALHVGAGGHLYALVRAPRPGVPRARSTLEAELYLDLTPCDCGAVGFPWDRGPADRYAGVCPSCGAARVYDFDLTDAQRADDVPIQPEIYFGSGPSELLDPGQWLRAADRYAAAVPEPSDGLTGDARWRASLLLKAAEAATLEARSTTFGSDGHIPAGALWTESSRAAYRWDRDRFAERRLLDRELGYHGAVFRMGRIEPRPATRADLRLPVLDRDRDRRWRGGLHRLLLRLAGRMPGDWLREMREVVAGGEVTGMAPRLAADLTHHEVTVTDGDLALLTGMTRTVFRSSAVVLRTAPETPATGHTFRPGPLDGVDLAVADLLGRHPDVRRVARAWRAHPDAGFVPDRVLLVEVTAGPPPWRMTGWLQERLATFGDPRAEVEVWTEGTLLPPYHRAALAAADGLRAEGPEE